MKVKFITEAFYPSQSEYEAHILKSLTIKFNAKCKTQIQIVEKTKLETLKPLKDSKHSTCKVKFHFELYRFEKYIVGCS